MLPQRIPSTVKSIELVNSLRGSHGALDVERADVLPILLEERHEEVDCENDVAAEVVLRHLHVTNTDGQTQHLQKKINTMN